MRVTTEQPDANVIEAAGGILWRQTPSGPELAVIHRPYYDDWTLPKGKREPGERWQETALREVEEETGIQARLTSFAGSTAYTVNGVAKVVLFWNMAVEGEDTFKPNDEVNKMVWLTPSEAIRRLSYPSEQDLLRSQKQKP